MAKVRLADTDVDALLDTCLREAESGDSAAVASFDPAVLRPTSAAPLRLSTISNVNGINALAPRSPLDFGPNHMCVVFGGNGSGKSSYVRILKHACGARNPGALHPNVFADGGAAQSADITYSKATQEYRVSWSTSVGVHSDLRPVDIFDTDCGRTYLENETEVTYEPPALVFFSDLITVCEQVSRRIDTKLEGCRSAKPHMPSEFVDTAAGRWYSSLEATTPTTDATPQLKWEAEDDSSLAKLEQRLAEKAPQDRIRQLAARKSHIEELVREIETPLSRLSEDNCNQILRLRKDLLTKRDAARAAATRVFAGGVLEGIGTDVWKLLWEHARSYSEELAYPGHTFPHLASDARCVLCDQALSTAAKSRLASLEEFVKGEAEKAANAAEKALEAAIAELGEIPSDQDIRTRCDAAGLTYQGDMPPVVTSLAMLRERRAKLLTCDSGEVLPAAPDLGEWLEATRKTGAEYAATSSKYAEDAASDIRPQLRNELLELRARRWLFEQRASVEAEVARLQAVEHLTRAKRLTNTSGLSRKKGELAESLITETFVQRFRDELAELKASRIKVELVKKRVDRGRVLHELRLSQARPRILREVLSEGEHRVVALAAFLADVTGKGQPAPFVFDDPISSLDQDFEEAVVQRLVRLSADRQVIVFTHRASLLVLLQEYGKREGREPSVTCVRAEAWGTGEPGDTPLFAKKPERALNALLGESLAKAKKVRDLEGEAAYAMLAKAICSDFRILLERMIESELLADVVQRFRRALNTQGKLDKLSRITQADCKVFDELMTKYSRYEHSQPIEAPIAPPTPEELKADMEALKKWHAEFGSRPQ